MANTRLGFVGAGFVGGAMIRGFSGYFPIFVYDRYQKIGSLEEVVENSDVVFLSLPSPAEADGSCDTTIVDEMLYEINELCLDGDDPLAVVIRSTIPPDYFSEAGATGPVLLKTSTPFNRLNIVYMPEFLTARTADLDFIMSSRFILGVSDPDELTPGDTLVRQVFNERFPRTRVAVMTWEEASFVKYATNTFFTVKVSFFNELYDACELHEVNPQHVIEEVMNDGRIGRSHFRVPGPDGRRGWGGACFPKDTAAYIKLAEGNSTMVEAAREVNNRVRKGDNE